MAWMWSCAHVGVSRQSKRCLTLGSEASAIIGQLTLNTDAFLNLSQFQCSFVTLFLSIKYLHLPKSVDLSCTISLEVYETVPSTCPPPFPILLSRNVAFEPHHRLRLQWSLLLLFNLRLQWSLLLPLNLRLQWSLSPPFNILPAIQHHFSTKVCPVVITAICQLPTTPIHFTTPRR